MSRAFVGLAVVLGAGLLLLTWLVGEERAGPGTLSESIVAQRLAARRSAELAVPERLAGDELELGSEKTRSAARSASREERPTIAGRVVVAGGIPAGEVLRVTAEVYVGAVNQRGNKRQLSTPVAADGAFQLTMPASARYALLDLDGQTLYLSETVKALPGAADVVLRPGLLAAIVGRVLPPLGVLPATENPWADVEVVCASNRESPLDFGELIERSERERPVFGPLRVKPSGEGVFGFYLVPAGIELFVSVKHLFGPEHVEKVEPLLPGERRQLVVALDAGARISGIVVDEHGAPVAGVHVATWVPGGSMSSSETGTETDSAGRFELAGLARRSWKVTTLSHAFARKGEAFVDATAGDVRDLLLSVVRGSFIEGTVSWPDGRPAKSFRVMAKGPGSSRGTTSTAGRFRVDGLQEGSYEIEVRASEDGVTGTASAQDVRAGGTPLALVLEVAAFQLHGIVVDSGNQPVEDFTVTWGSRAGSSSRHASSGSFALAGLSAGELEVGVRAKGYQSAKQQVVIGADPAAPLHFVLLPAGVVRGHVLDPGGNPVARAIVTGDEARQATSSDDGTFELSATAARVRIRARKDGHVASEFVEIEVGSGSIITGVVLQLREACRLEGRLVDAAGRPIAGAWVLVRSGGESEHVESDGRGEFVLDELPPGEAEVFASRSSRDAERTRAVATLSPGRSAKLELRLK